MKQIVATILLCLLTVASYGQKLALRNNLLYDATLTPNLDEQQPLVQELWWHQ